jgi:type II secretory pathway pseudopilin PulG
MHLAQATKEGERGFAMAALLVAIAVMAIVMSALLPVWRTLSIREKEEELVWRGQQYDRAIQLYRRKNAAPGVPNIDALIQGRFLRKKYRDPITNDDFDLIGVNAGAPTAPGAQQPKIGFGQLIGGVRSKSKAHSMRELDGRSVYNEWQFTYMPWKPGGQPTVPDANRGGRSGFPGPGSPGGAALPSGQGSSGRPTSPPPGTRPPPETSPPPSMGDVPPSTGDTPTPPEGP